MNHIDLFSGIGGFALACQWAGIKTEIFCEKDKRCQEFLQRTYLGVPIVPDIREFDGTEWRGRFLLTAGVPCQPASRAGKQRGKDDDRWLWPEAIRVIGEAKPSWCLLENPPGIGDVGLEGILAGLENEGYEVRVFGIPACAVNSPQLRNRYWIVANAKEQRLEGRSNGSQGKPTEGSGFLPARSSQSDMAHSKGNNDRREPRSLCETDEQQESERQEGWIPEPPGSSQSDLAHRAGFHEGGVGLQMGQERREEERTTNTRNSQSDMADSSSERRQQNSESAPENESQYAWRSTASDNEPSGDVQSDVADGIGRNGWWQDTQKQGEKGRTTDRRDNQGDVADTESQRRERQDHEDTPGQIGWKNKNGWSSKGDRFWDSSVWLPCADGKVRRSVGDAQRMAHGLPLELLEELGTEGRQTPQECEVHRSILAALGNSIVWPVAYEIIRSIILAEEVNGKTKSG